MTRSSKPALNTDLPVAIVGAGPVGLTTALGLAYHGIHSVLLEEDERLSVDTKAGTTLTRTLEVFRRYGVADHILAVSLRLDEIGEIDRETGRPRAPVRLDVLGGETRYPFVINLPQHDMEPVLATALDKSGLSGIRFASRFKRLEQAGDRVRLWLETLRGEETLHASYVLACDGGRSTVREALGLVAEGTSIDERYALVDLVCDLDVGNRRDYPYLAYFSDVREWMILVRHPHCWRFLFPLAPGVEEPSAEELCDKALSFIGKVDNVRILQKVVYRTHHRVANKWRVGRVFLMGDAAHLITPMWALGLNTGATDASNLPWRLAWVMRGWADDGLLDGYEREQRPLALYGSGQMAEAARASMAKAKGVVSAMSDNNWSNAYTRGMLGVRLDIDGKGAWSLVKTATEPPVEPGDRIPDALVHTPPGTEIRLHDLAGDRFVALYFTDVRRRPPIPLSVSPALIHFAVSRWDAPLDSGIRDRALLDPGDRLKRRLGVADDTLVLVRPDEHIAAIVPMATTSANDLYRAIVGRYLPE